MNRSAFDLFAILSDSGLEPMTALGRQKPMGFLVAEVIEAVRRKAPEVTELEIDAAVKGVGGERLGHISLDLWPNLERLYQRLRGRPVPTNDVYYIPAAAWPER